MHWIYANKESKTDIDIEKISLYDHIGDDQEETGTIEVISPYGKRTSEPDNKDLHVRDAMFKLRTRDKFKVVS